jgi:hypothetical protein
VGSASHVAALWQQGAGTIQGRGAGHHADLCIAVALTLWVQGLEAVSTIIYHKPA